MIPKDYISFAELLVDKTDDSDALKAAKYRSAISRAYYAVFHHGVKVLRNCSATLSNKADDHQIVCQTMCECAVKGFKSIGGNLRDLRDWRNDADYQLDNDSVEKKGNVAAKVSLARKLIDGMGGLSKNLDTKEKNKIRDKSKEVSLRLSARSTR